MSSRPTIGLVSVYFSLFDEQMPPGFRESREEVARTYARALERSFDVVYPGLLASDEDGRRANAVLRAAGVDAVVFAPSMAAPPSYGLTAVEGLDVPLVIWNAPVVERLPDDMTQAAATVNTTQVGCVMFANPLVRAGRFFATVTARPDDEDAVGCLLRMVRAAAAANSLRGATALRVGDPIPGYFDIEASAAELARLGVRETSVSRDELNAAVRSVERVREGELLSELERRRWEDHASSANGLSARLALALGDLVDAHGASCGTVNCHGPWLRWNDELGITACLGVSLLTERGVPIACTGDQTAALALLLARAVSGRALYCEFYAPDLNSGLMLVAAGGEGDPAWADESAGVRIEPNAHYPGVAGNGAALAFRLRTGPATALSLTPVGGTWRLVWATGEIIESRYPRMGGPNGMFRFDSGDAAAAGERWIASGATHHNALAGGRLDVEIPVLAGALGIEALRI